MKNFFPPKNQSFTFLQTNRSDVLGSIWSTFNIDLQSNLGVIRVAPRLRINRQTSDEANLGSPVNFQFFDNRYFAICGSRIFKNSGYQPNLPFAEDASSGVQTNYQPEDADLVVFADMLWATGNGALYYKVANSAGTGAWTSLSTSPSGTSLMVIGRKFNRLYLSTGGSNMDSTDGTTYAATGDYTLNLGVSDENVIASLCETQDFIWIGTINTSNENGRGSIYAWDGISAQPTFRYYLKAPGAYAMVTLNEIPYVMDTFGILSKFTGTSFEEVGRLPFSDLLLSDSSTGFSDSNDRFIHPKGMMATKNNTILVFVRNDYDDATFSVSENAPSGIWEWSEQYGFTHKYALTFNKVGSANNDAITDYGQNRIGTGAVDAFVSALAQAYTPDDSANRNGMIMCGATYFINATQQTSAIFIDDSINVVKKKGYFVTTWFESNEVEDKWTRLWEVHRRLLQSTDSIVYKYRVNEEAPVYADITWVDTTHFTTAVDVTAYGPTAAGFNGTSGGEVEGIAGVGSGQCSHITNISGPSGGLYTVTLDTAITGATTTTARARFQKWVKLFPEATGQVLSWSQMAIGANNTRFQLKCCMSFQGDDEFHRLAIFSNEDIKVGP